MTRETPFTAAADRLLGSLVLSAEAEKNATQAKTPFRISNAGQCTRKMAYQAVAPELAKEDGARLILARMFGEEVHNLVRRHLSPVLSDVERSLSFTYEMDDEVFTVGGHIDGIVTLPGQEPRLLEIKSISDIGFDMIQYADGDPYYAIEETYRGAHAAYRMALKEMPGVFLFVNKNTSHTLWVEVPKEIDHKALAVAVDRWHNVYTWLRARTDDALPPDRMRDHQPVAETKRKKPTGRTILPWQCSYCKFVESCWPEAALDLEGGKPVYVVQGGAANV